MHLNDLSLITFLILLLTESECTSGNKLDPEWFTSNFKVEFDSKEVYHTNLLNRLYWTDKNERSTSRNYTLWEEADVYLLEWPGNVTTFHYDTPVVKWGRHRAKYLEDHCGMEHTGIEMRAYAYKYVYLTYGPYRLTQTFTIPLTIPRSVLPFQTLATLSRHHSYEENNLNTLVVFDIAFVFDTLLLAYSEGVIRVSGLEMGWAEMSTKPKRPLIYSLSKGIKDSVDRLVVQSCCLKTDFCPFGNVVVAFRDYSYPHVIYVANDSAQSFIKVQPSASLPGYLRVVLSYPEYNTITVFYGNESEIKRSNLIVPFQVLRQQNHKIVHTSSTISTTGILQGMRLGMETSFVLWDDCNVWYSANAASSMILSRSMLYIHKKIGSSLHHKIVGKRCTFGVNSTLEYGKGGNWGLLDKDNVFYLGVDTKTNFSQLIALKMDMSLLIPGTEMSVVPHFDISERPKLIYPPKFLDLPTKLRTALGPNYQRRHGMRLLPKSVFPSDFIQHFYVENVKRIKEKYMPLLLEPCETSSLKINHSISQRRKFYQMHNTGHLNFTVIFKSKLSTSNQLKFEPKSVLKYLKIVLKLVSVDQIVITDPLYWIKYTVEIKANTLSSTNKVFRVNFYTKNALRCHYQPRVPVFIKVTDNQTSIPNAPDEDDMTKSVYLKSVTGGETEYLKMKPQEKGQTMKVDTCPLSKMKTAEL